MPRRAKKRHDYEPFMLYQRYPIICQALLYSSSTMTFFTSVVMPLLGKSIKYTVVTINVKSPPQVIEELCP